MVSQAIDPPSSQSSSLREVRFYPRVIKYDICDCGSRKLEKSPKCSICKNKENGHRVGLGNKGLKHRLNNINKLNVYSVFTLSFIYVHIYLNILLF